LVDPFRSFDHGQWARVGATKAVLPHALHNAVLRAKKKSCRYKRRSAGKRHVRYHSWRDTKTQGYPPPGFSVRAGTRTDRLRTNLRARAGGMGTLSAVLGV